MKNETDKLGYIDPKNKSTFSIDLSKIKKIDISKYNIIKNTSVGGDNPKKVIRKKIGKKHSKYIAKTANKWYPNESITEYLIFRIGTKLGFNMAKSELIFAEDQIRFLSKYFLKRTQVLDHGKQIYSRSTYFNNINTVENIEKNRCFKRKIHTTNNKRNNRKRISITS